MIPGYPGHQMMPPPHQQQQQQQQGQTMTPQGAQLPQGQLPSQGQMVQQGFRPQGPYNMYAQNPGNYPRSYDTGGVGGFWF